MASQETVFKVVRHSDKHVYDALQDIAEDLIKSGRPAVDVYPLATPSVKLIDAQTKEPDERLSEFLNVNTIAAKRLKTTIGKIGVTVDRAIEDNKVGKPLEYFDEVKIDGGGDDDPVFRARLYRALREKLKALDELSYRDAIDEVSRTVLESREREITKLNDLSLNIVGELDKAILENRRQHEQQMQAAAAAAQKQRDEFNAFAVARQGEIDAEQTRVETRAAEIEEKLAEREAELEKLRSESNRRTLRLDVHKRLNEWSARFGLTRGTYCKAGFVGGVFTALLTGFGTAFGFAFAQYTASAADWHTLIPLGATTVGFGVTALFLVRWANQLYRAHADEEFRLKRVQLDIERASWVYEMAREWEKDSGGQKMPQYLIERLTRDLFEKPQAESVATSAGDVLISKGLFGRWKVVRVNKSGVELERFDDNDDKRKGKRDRSDDD